MPEDLPTLDKGLKELEKENENLIIKTIFKGIKHDDYDGNEYCYARELKYILGYNQWRSINDLIKLAKAACKESDNNVDYHLAVDRKMIKLAKGATRKW